MEGIVNVHFDFLVFMISIFVFIIYLLSMCIYYFNQKNRFYARAISHSEQLFLEIVWTVIPVIIIVLLGIPSLALLYASNELLNPSITVQVIGSQWYWTYEYNDIDVSFDSYMILEEDLKFGELRLLEVDHRLVLPANVHVRLLLTASDVIHSWAVPSLGIKTDAIPGRLNNINIFIKKPGVYYGQCSEICGVNHGFMPIVVQALNEIQFMDWVNHITK
jgi:cytochrome c oxidase subunit II